MSSYYCLRSSLPLLCILIGAASAAQDIAAIDPLLMKIIREQRAARQRIETAHVLFEVQIETTDSQEGKAGSTSSFETVEMWHRGEESRVDRMANVEERKADGTVNVETRGRRYVRNQNYRADWLNWRGGTASDLAVYPHDTIAYGGKGIGGRDTVAHLWDPMLFAFAPFMPGIVQGEFRETRWPLMANEYVRVRVERTGNKERFRYEFYDRTDTSQPVMSAVIDPSRGYTVAENTYDNGFLCFDTPGYHRVHWKADYEEVKPGIWLPKEIRREKVRHDSTASVTITVRNWTVNEPIPDSRFTWQDLEFPESQAVITHPDGRKEGVTVGALARALTPEKPYTGPNWVRVSDAPPASALPPNESPPLAEEAGPEAPPPIAEPDLTQAPAESATVPSRLPVATTILAALMAIGAATLYFRRRA